jgi:hypothetical protein
MSNTITPKSREILRQMELKIKWKNLNDAIRELLRVRKQLRTQGVDIKNTTISLDYQDYANEQRIVELNYFTPPTPEDLAAEAAAQEKAKQERQLLWLKLKKEFGA